MYNDLDVKGGGLPMSGKRFAIPGNQIRPIATGFGGCYASDMITVDGERVGYMYRESPDFDADSGWRFCAGKETQAYVDTPSNFGIYDVNTIANYDSEIVPLLRAPIGSAFEREGGLGALVRAPSPEVSAD